MPDAAAWPMIAAMLGATVMPHAIYLHSTLAVDRHRPDGRLHRPLPTLLPVQRWDVGAALALAGTVNVAMLLLAASTLTDTPGDTIETAYAVFTRELGRLPAVVFALGLLASGVGSTIVGTHAGSQVLKDVLKRPPAATTRRIVTLAPAVAFLLAGVPPTTILVASQTVLSFGIAIAVVPLALLTRDPGVMGPHADGPVMQATNAVIAAAVVVLNVVTLVTTFT